VSITYQQYLGQFPIDATTKDFSVEDTGGGGAQAIALTTGYYYIAGYTGEVEAQLCEHMQAQIRNEGGNFADAEVTYSGSTGLITINCPSTTTLTIGWTDSLLQSLLGFTGTQSGAKSYTATYPPRYVWRPTEELSDYPTALSTWWASRSTSRYKRANSGKAFAIAGTTVYDGSYAYRLLTAAEMLKASQTNYESLEQFFDDVIAAAKPIRCYPDRTANTSSDFFTAQWKVDGEVGSFVEYFERHRSNYNGLFNFDFALDKYV